MIRFLALFIPIFLFAKLNLGISAQALEKGGKYQNVVDARVSINGKELAKTNSNFVNLKLNKGKYLIIIEKQSEDEQWYYSGRKNIALTENTKVVINLAKNPTNKRLDRLEKEQKARDLYNKKLNLANEKKLKPLISLDQNFTSLENLVYDSKTKLFWQDELIVSKLSWKQAIFYCKKLELGGFNDWRLPKLKEILSIVDYKKSEPAINKSFKNIKFEDGFYWSITHDKNHINQAFLLEFYHGRVKTANINQSQYIRCVREKL